MRTPFRLVRYAIGIPRYIYSRADEWRKKEHCVAAPTSRLLPSSRIDNPQGDKNAILIKEHAIVLGQLLVLKNSGLIKLGQHCYIGDQSRILSACSITIGDRVLISYGVSIHDYNAHSLSAKKRHQHFADIFLAGRPEIFDDISVEAVVIEDDAWIGFNAAILKGVTIGKGAIVGACSVVTRDVAPYSIVAGNPAILVGSAKA